MNNPYATLMSTEEDLFVEPLDKVDMWKLRLEMSDNDCTEIKRPNVKMGSEIGPLYISCYDVYSN